MTLVKQGHESLYTSHVSFLTPFDPGSAGWRTQGRMTNSATTQCWVHLILGCHKNRSKNKQKIKTPRPRTPSILSVLNLRCNRFLDPARAPLRLWIGFGIKSLYPVCGVGRCWGGNNHLIVEITGPDHYQNLINRSLARGWARRRISWKFVHELLRHHADIEINWQGWKCNPLQR